MVQIGDSRAVITITDIGTKISMGEARFIFGLSHQAVFGDNNNPEPSRLDLFEW